MKTSLKMRVLTRWVRPCFAMVAALLWSVLTGELPAQDFTYTKTNGSITLTGYTGPGGNVAIPTTIDGTPVTAIGGQAFAGIINLTAITIPDSVTNIEDGVMTKGGGLGAFNFCSGLTNVTMGSRLVHVGLGAFAWSTSLRRVSIPDSVTTIGDFAFHYCKGLTDAKIGKSVKQLGPGFGYAFQGCTNLTTVTIPGSVTNLGNYSFSECVSLASVMIENGVASLGFNAFELCASLTNLTLPASVTRIGDHAFASCTNLAGVYFAGSAPVLLSPGDVFYGTSNVTVYYLPGTTGWGPTYAGRPTMLWNPEAKADGAGIGARQNRFGFNIAGTANLPLVIEASANFPAGSWVLLQSCTLTNGLLYFSDPEWTNYPRRFYRIRSP